MIPVDAAPAAASRLPACLCRKVVQQAAFGAGRVGDDGAQGARQWRPGLQGAVSIALRGQQQARVDDQAAQRLERGLEVWQRIPRPQVGAAEAWVPPLELGIRGRRIKQGVGVPRAL